MRRAAVTAWAVSLVAVSLVAACAAPTPLTELVIVADTDLRVPADVDTIRIAIRDGQGTMREASADLGSGAPRPVTLAIVSRTTLGPLEVDVIGARGGSEVVRRSARVSFVEGRTRALRLDLLGSCRAVACEPGQTCGGSGCRGVDVGPEELTDWDGGAPALDAAVGPIDASVPSDAPAEDAGSPRDSGAPDAPAGECASAGECDDGVACTVDTCDPTAGCVHTPNAGACDDGNACTTDSCDAVLGCRATPVHSACAMGSYCDVAAGCTVAPSFTTVYSEALRPRCGPCHTMGSRSGGLDLATQTAAYLELVNVPAVCGTGNVLVIPRDAARSVLWRKLAGVDLCGDLMPRSSMPLDAAQVAQVARWINGGALE